MQLNTENYKGDDMKDWVEQLQQGLLLKAGKDADAAVQASYVVRELLAKAGKDVASCWYFISWKKKLVANSSVEFITNLNL